MKYNTFMYKTRILLTLGVFMTILPYLGFPYSWKDVIFSVSGLALIYFSYTLYREYKAKDNQKKTFDNFSENSNFEDKEI